MIAPSALKSVSSDRVACGIDEYRAFISRKERMTPSEGFSPIWLPDFLFGFQSHCAEWAIRRGRAALIEDCGLGKTPQLLVYAENVARHTNKNVLILTPLAVSGQTIKEGEKFGVEVKQSRDGQSKGKITVANYERLHLFNPHEFVGVICDEASILKNYSGATRNAIIAFLRDAKYRLLCSATPSPNDYTELGNCVEALGVMRRVEMLSMYFIHDSADTGTWRLRGHGEDAFWRFVASWARAVRKPSDLGFDDGDFILPELRMKQHTLESKALDGWLFPSVALTLDEQRKERRATLQTRCEKVAELANANSDHFIAWCSLNAESELIAKLTKNCIELTGSMSVDEKEEILEAFSAGKIENLVTKPEICGYGLNWQHCHQFSFFPSHSHEQFYQLVRRCWRFGQKHPVDGHIVTTEAESAVLNNLLSKEEAASHMFDRIIANMAQYYEYRHESYNPTKKMEFPPWLNHAA